MPNVRQPGVAELAQNLARNLGFAVFPCRGDKRPALRGWPQRASADPDEIARLWAEHPASLIGVVTGARSNVSVLDVDPDHSEAGIWWRHHHHRLLRTRTYRTRRNGLHLWFRHRDGVTNSQGKIARGIDTRGTGGYCITWYAAGFECIDHTPLQPWPPWLLDELKRQPPPPVQRYRSHQGDDSGIDGILRTLATASEGSRNGTMFWCACRLAERGMGQDEIERLLLPIAINIGLTDIETRRSIKSAMGRRSA
jgi:hypothetical protein